MPAGLPLTDRAPGDVLFLTATGAVTAARFVAEARALAARLPERPYAINACTDRYLFALGLAAALLAGQVSLLPGESGAAALAELARAHPDGHVLADAPLPGAGPDVPVTRLSAAAAMAGAATLPPPVLPADRRAIIVFTSGTTGAPVATEKSWGELVHRTRAAGHRFDLGVPPGRGVVATVPPGHMYGLETSVLLPWHAQVAVWCGPAFYPDDIRAALAALTGPRTLVTTPLHLQTLLRSGALAVPPGQVISATAPLARGLAAAAEDAWGAEVLEILGASEVGSIASRRTTAGALWHLYDGVEFVPDQPGGLAIRAPGAAARRFADLVECGADGRTFVLLGRPEDMVKLGGRRASLAALAREAMSIEGVEDAVFVAPRDPERDPAARLAALMVAPGLDAAGLIERMRARIEPVFLPRPLILLDRLPRNRLGKIQRAALLEAVERHGQERARLAASRSVEGG